MTEDRNHVVACQSVTTLVENLTVCATHWSVCCALFCVLSAEDVGLLQPVAKKLGSLVPAVGLQVL